MALEWSMRPLWTGAITFGLVNIPIGLYSATRHKSSLNLRMLRDSDHSRINYKYIAEADGKEVPREHIVKGYEYEKDRFVVLTEDDFKKVDIKSSQVVEIREFVKLADVEPRFFNEPYFLAPAKSGAKAYSLLRATLEQTGLGGVSKVVIRPPREHLALIKALDKMLVLETLHFADELRDAEELPLVEGSVSPKEMQMALSLVRTMTSEWDPEEYHDEYREALLKLIEQKVKAGAIPAPKRQGAPATGKVIDLAELLQKSLGKAEKAPRKAPRHKPPHRKAA